MNATTAPTHVMIRMPAERGEQIKQLAAKLDSSITGAIEHMINLAIKAGELDDSLPSHKATLLPDSRRVVISLPTFALPALSARHAEQIAELFEAAAANDKTGGTAVILPNGPNLRAQIARIGRGVVIALAKDGTVTDKHSMTVAMARDFARQIRRAVAEAREGLE